MERWKARRKTKNLLNLTIYFPTSLVLMQDISLRKLRRWFSTWKSNAIFCQIGFWFHKSMVINRKNIWELKLITKVSFREWKMECISRTDFFYVGRRPAFTWPSKKQVKEIDLQPIWWGLFKKLSTIKISNKISGELEGLLPTPEKLLWDKLLKGKTFWGKLL